MPKIKKATKKQMTSDVKEFGRLIQGLLGATNAIYPLKEKSNEFINKMADYIEDSGTKSKEETDGLHNTISDTKANLAYLATLFTNNEKQQKNTEEFCYEKLADIFNESMDAVFMEEVKKNYKK